MLTWRTNSSAVWTSGHQSGRQEGQGVEQQQRSPDGPEKSVADGHLALRFEVVHFR